MLLAHDQIPKIYHLFHRFTSSDKEQGMQTFYEKPGYIKCEFPEHFDETF